MNLIRIKAALTTMISFTFSLVFFNIIQNLQLKLLIYIIGPLLIFLIIKTFSPQKKYKDLSTKPSISIIIPAKNEEKVIANTLESIINLDYENYEVFIVNDGSNDSTKNIVENYIKKFKNFYLIDIPTDYPIHGKANAINEAMKHVTGDLVLIIDADIRLPKDFFSKILKPFSDQKVLAVQSGIKAYNSKQNFLTFICSSDLEVTNILMQYFLPKRSFGCGIIFRTSTLKKILPLKTDTISEDEQINMYIRKNKINLVYKANVFIYEHVPSKFAILFKQRKRWFIGMFYENIRHHLLTAFVNKSLIFTIDLFVINLFINPFSNTSIILFSVLIALLFVIITKSKHFEIRNPLLTYFGSLISYIILLLIMNFSILKLLFLSPNDLIWYKTPKE